MDEMIEANALWHITRPNAPENIIALVGSTHSGHLDIIHVQNTLAQHLPTLGYQLQKTFGLQDIHNVSEAFCQKVTVAIPQKAARWLKKSQG
jgi:hypothetical protein